MPTRRMTAVAVALGSPLLRNPDVAPLWRTLAEFGGDFLVFEVERRYDAAVQFMREYAAQRPQHALNEVARLRGGGS